MNEQVFSYHVENFRKSTQNYYNDGEWFDRKDPKKQHI